MFVIANIVLSKMVSETNYTLKCKPLVLGADEENEGRRADVRI
jgi:hypothetical protein